MVENSEKLVKKGRFFPYVRNIFSSFVHQKVLFVCTVLCAVFVIAGIWCRSYENLFHIAEGFLASVLVSFTASLHTRRFSGVRRYIIQVAACAAAFAAAFSIVQFVPKDSYASLYYGGLMCLLLCLTVFEFIPSGAGQGSGSSFFASLMKYFLFTMLMSVVLFLGFDLLLIVFDALLLHISALDKVVSSAAALVFIVFFVNVFAFYFFEKMNEPSGKAFKIIVLYIMFPVYALLLVLLYLYLFKTLLVSHELPHGQVNWFVSFASLAFIVFSFALQEYRGNRFVSFFYRFGAVIILPLLVFQLIAFIIRINAYGFTGFRYSSLLYMIFALCAIVLWVVAAFTKHDFTKYSLIVLALLVVVDSLSPLNLINVAFNSQNRRMVSVLEKYGMYSKEQDSLADYNAAEVEQKITYEDSEILEGSFNYMMFTSEHEKPVYFKSDFEKTFGFKPVYKSDEYDKMEYFTLEAPEGTSVSVRGYSRCVYKKVKFYDYTREENKKPELELSDGTKYDLVEICGKLRSVNAEGFNGAKFTLDSRHDLLVVKANMRYRTSAKKYQMVELEGYVLEK